MQGGTWHQTGPKSHTPKQTGAAAETRPAHYQHLTKTPPLPPLPSPPPLHSQANMQFTAGQHTLSINRSHSLTIFTPWKISRLHIIHPVAMVTYIYPPNLSSIDALARNSTRTLQLCYECKHGLTQLAGSALFASLTRVAIPPT